MTKKIIEFISYKILGKISWNRLKFLFIGKEYDITPAQRDAIRMTCTQGVHIWLTRRNSHFTTYLINLADYLLSFLAYAKKGFKGTKPVFGFYSHAFINADHDSFIQAITKGVTESRFDEVFNVDAVACLIPKSLSIDEWKNYSELLTKYAFARLGVKYDAVFNIKDESEVSCIELIRICLTQALGPNEYLIRFKNFETLIEERKNLTPDMLKECGDFITLFELKE